MSDQQYIKFRCLPVCQPIGTFYIGVVRAQDLFQIAYSDIRRLRVRDVEEFLGIERPLVDSRVKELRQYVRTVDASFPTSIVLHVSSEYAEYDAKEHTMRLPRAQNVAKILDGQHRIAGLEGFDQAFQLNVTIFIDMDIADQAMLFSTINLKQTKVQKSLVYDLYEFAKGRSPEKTCHNIAKLLNRAEGSPFKEKIKILGRAMGKPFETLTQATFVERLLPYISSDPMRDRDMLKRGKKLPLIGPPLIDKLIFRNMWIMEKDAEVARIVDNYFLAVAKKWPDAWFTKQAGKILSRTTGFTALMQFLRDAYLGLGQREGVVAVSSFQKIFSQIRLKEEHFNPVNYPPGGVGERKLYNDLVLQWGRSKPD